MLFSHLKSSLLFSKSTVASLLLETQQTVIDLAEKAHQEASAALELDVKNIIQQQVQEKLLYFIEQIKLARQRQ